MKPIELNDASFSKPKALSSNLKSSAGYLDGKHLVKAYGRTKFADFREDIKSFCPKRGAGHISVPSDAPIERVLFGEQLKAGALS